jgi:hypothetical protein
VPSAHVIERLLTELAVDVKQRRTTDAKLVTLVPALQL